jgi:amidase
MTKIDAFATAGEMLRALRAREVSAVELLELHIERGNRLNPAINAIVTPDYDRARVAAQAADAARARGDERLLLGLPLTIKDCIDVAGLPTTAGVIDRKDALPPHDARIVESIKAAGGVIFGKTNIPPLAGDWNADNPVFGRTNNPWNLERVPGGSTGGGAAALAAGLTPLELGSDIGGSIRVPAAMCGVFGHRPSWTAIPNSGHFPGSPLPNPAMVLNTLGPLARSAADLELAFTVVAGPDIGQEAAWRIEPPAPRHESLAGFRVALLPPIAWVPLDASVQFALENVAGALARAGAKVVPAQPEGFGDWSGHFTLYSRLLQQALTSNLSREHREAQAEKLAGFDDPAARAAAEGLRASGADLANWLGERELFRAAFRDFFRSWDILLAPITPRPAYPHPDVSVPMPARSFTIGGESAPYTCQVVHPHLAILCGQPATAFPAGMSEEGLPVGLQAIGPFLEDRTTLRFVELLCAEIGGFERPPGYA